MKVNRRILAVIVVAALLLCSCKSDMQSSASQNNQEYDCVIGIVYFPSWDLLSEAIIGYTTYLEEHFNVKIEYANYSNAGMSHFEMTEYLCDLGVDIILSTSTEGIPECVQLCEERKVYFLQIFETPYDTDIIEKYETNPYYLGYIRSNEDNTARLMANALLDGGCEQIAIIAMENPISTSEMHLSRMNNMQNAILKKKKEALTYVLRLHYFQIQEGIALLHDLDYEFDGMIATINTFFYTLDELKILFGNNNMKFSYFEIGETTREDFLSGDLLLVPCGQHNIIGLAFAYAYHYITSPIGSNEKLEMETNYITLASAEDYDIYIQTCIEQYPYSADELKKMIQGLERGNELLHSYARSYSLEDVQQRNH